MYAFALAVMPTFGPVNTCDDMRFVEVEARRWMEIDKDVLCTPSSRRVKDTERVPEQKQGEG